jgi:hypothetical protein
MPDTANLVAYYELEESSGARADSWGTYTLTDNNTVTSGTGIQGTAAVFTPANSESLSTADATLCGTLSTAASWTLVFWVYPTDDSVGLMEPAGTLGAGFVGLLIRRRGLTPFGSTVVAWDYYNDSAVATRVEGPTSTPINTWSMLGMVYDSSAQTLTAYQNGTLGTPVSFTGSSATQAAFRIGNRGSGGGTYWDGRVDECSIWPAALSNDELDWIYNSGTGRALSEYSSGATAAIFLNHVQVPHLVRPHRGLTLTR